MLVEFDISKIGDLDGGRVLEAISQAIERAVHDCEDRPGLKKARKVTLEMSLTPIQDDDGTMESIDLAFGVGEKRPSRTSKNYNLAARKAGNRWKLLFNDLSQDDVNQMTIDQVMG